ESSSQVSPTLRKTGTRLDLLPESGTVSSPAPPLPPPPPPPRGRPPPRPPPRGERDPSPALLKCGRALRDARRVPPPAVDGPGQDIVQDHGPRPLACDLTEQRDGAPHHRARHARDSTKA